MNSNLDFRISHAHWETTLEELYLALTMASLGEIISVVGASRVGKSKLIHTVAGMLDGPEHSVGDNFTHSIYVRALNDGLNGTFCSKSFSWSLLDKVDHPVYSAGLDVNGLSSVYRGNTTSVFNKAFVKAIKNLPVRYVFIDEAQHVKYTASARVAPHAIMDFWKTMAEDANIILVIIGSYFLLNIMGGSGHLLGREDTIVMPRYSNSVQDLNEYAAIIRQLESNLPGELIGDSLVAHTRILQRYSFGCIGLLKVWIKRAYRLAKREGKAIDLDILESSRPRNNKIDIMQEEIVWGERLLNNQEDEDLFGEAQVPIEKIKGKAIKKSNRRPFKVKPKRYEPGGRGHME